MYLAVDLWDKRVWIAISVNWIVFPKEIVNRVEIIKKLKTYINNYNIKVIIVGLPYDLYWVKTKQLEKTNKFIKKLKLIFLNQEIIWIDERFTSFEAKEVNKKMTKTNFKDKIDDISAAIILESYLKKVDKQKKF